MRRNILKAIAAVTMTAATGIAMAQAPIKFGYGASEENPQGVAAKRFSEAVSKKTNGRVNITTYSSGKLGSDPAMQSATQGGTIELMVGPTSTLVTVVKDFAIFDLPYQVSTYKEVDAMLDGPVGQYLTHKLESVGLVGLAYWENGFRNVTNSKRPITKIEDLSGLKTRVIQNTVFIDTFKALGTNPVPMAFTELYGAMESKAIDAQENPVGLIESQKFYEVQKYLSVTGHVYSPYIVIANKKWFDSLQPADREIVKSTAVEMGVFQRQMQRDQVAKITETLKQKGMQVNELAPAEIQRLKAATRPVVAKYSENLSPELQKLLNSKN